MHGLVSVSQKMIGHRWCWRFRFSHINVQSDKIYFKLSETAGSSWFYSNDEATNFNADIANNNNFKSFNYKPKVLGNTETDGNNGVLKTVTFAVPLKYLSNFLRSLEISLINYKIELMAKWTKYCALRLVRIMAVLILTTLFLLSKTQKYISPL